MLPDPKWLGPRYAEYSAANAISAMSPTALFQLSLDLAHALHLVDIDQPGSMLDQARTCESHASEAISAVLHVLLLAVFFSLVTTTVPTSTPRPVESSISGGVTGSTGTIIPDAHVVITN